MNLKIEFQVISLALVFSLGLTASINNTVKVDYSNSSQFIQLVTVGSYYYYQCNPNPCANGGYCATDGYSYTCTCQNGFTGPNCLTYASLSNCLFNPCSGGSVCVIQSNGYYSCQCPTGYYGIYCQSNNYVCNPNPCYNGGACIQTGATTARCSCQNGYTGDLCQFATNNPCQINPCRNGGICTPIYSGNNYNLYQCSCLNGFGGSNCESVYNPCYTNGLSNCQNGGICTVNYNSFPYYECSCQNGYSGPNCQTLPYIPPSNCNDIDPLNCPTYAALKYCTNTYSVNGVTIPNYCAKSCGTCQVSLCVDTQPSCALWKSLNYCNLHPVNIYCRRTCNIC